MAGGAPTFDEEFEISIPKKTKNMEITDPAETTMTTEEEEIAMLRQRDSMASEMIAELRNSLEERESRVEFLEREIKSLKQTNAKSEMKVRELERRLFVSEMKEVEERSKRVRVEEKMREKIEERDREIEELEEREKGKEWILIGLRERVKEAERSVKKAMHNNGEKDKEEEEEKGKIDLQWSSLGIAGAVTAVVAAVLLLWFGRRNKSSFHLTK